MKIAYFGLPLGALLLLRDGHDLGPVVLSPVAAPGRRALRRELAGASLVDCISGVDDDVIERHLYPRPDALLSWFWTRKLPARWLERARRGAFGVHPSLLPRHRGPNPYFAAIDAGDALSGVTLHRLGEQYDTGEVIDSESVPVLDMNSWQLARALDRPGLGLLRRAATRLRAGDDLSGRVQDESLATWAGEPEGDQLKVQWHWPTERILRRIRALAPVPGLALNLRGENLVLVRARRIQPESLALHPGEAAVLEDRVSIRTGDGAIVLEAAEVSDSELTLGREALARHLRRRRP